jgi:hypothetical protein
MNLKPRTTAIVLATAALTLTTTTATAVLVGVRGGSMTERQVRTENSPTDFFGTTFTSIPNAALSVTVPGGTSRLVTGRFTAESECTGTSGGHCSVRLVAFNNVTSELVELNPRTGFEFAFDSVSADRFNSNSVARAIRLGAGSWTILVQQANHMAGVHSRLDDWTFEVDVNV